MIWLTNKHSIIWIKYLDLLKQTKQLFYNGFSNLFQKTEVKLKIWYITYSFLKKQIVHCKNEPFEIKLY